MSCSLVHWVSHFGSVQQVHCMLADRRGVYYYTRITTQVVWLGYGVSFSLVRNATMCLQGSRSGTR